MKYAIINPETDREFVIRGQKWVIISFEYYDNLPNTKKYRHAQGIKADVIVRKGRGKNYYRAYLTFDNKIYMSK